ncbi:uncharacterized protein [Aquarana catesbeiana]|uniref:uncharacterized protein isoform X2 n=1 Tax=Aquarana catesbeiana TaxID=8400 RepID=UPI003CCA1B65
MMEIYLQCISLLLILSLSVPTVSPVSHSHFFFATITNTTITNNFTSSYPDYYMTRSIDDITLFRYDSVNEVIERRVPWFRSTYPTLLFDSINQLRIQKNLQNVLQFIMNHVNDTEGFHVLQVLQGCVLYENLSNDTIFSYHYDGEPFLAFNVEEATWIPGDPKAQDFADILNMNDTVTNDTRNVLVHECIPHISKLLSLGKCTFNRREQPVVVVTQMPIKNTIYRLHCRAYGHYPKDISMTWYKNGEPVSESLLDRVTLPFPDITYLTQLSMNTTLLDDDVYTCIVTHSSMMSPLTAISHSHFFFTTVTNDITFYYPTYYSTRSIDDITLYWYDSNNEVIERRVPWFRRANSTLLDASISEFKEQLRMQRFLQMLKLGLNDTEGFHILQLLDGCVLYDNGTFDTLYRYHYDGKPFLSFNVKEANWTAEDPKAQYLTYVLNVNETKTKEIRNLLVNRCVPHIHELLSLGNCTFNRREKPLVKVTHKVLSNTTDELNCRAYGHSPENISMAWYLNEEQQSNITETLPLPDSTYLSSLLLNISTYHGGVYSCHLNHSSLKSTLVVEWGLPEETEPIGAIITICLAAVVIIVVIIVGSVLITKLRKK